MRICLKYGISESMVTKTADRRTINKPTRRKRETCTISASTDLVKTGLDVDTSAIGMYVSFRCCSEHGRKLISEHQCLVTRHIHGLKSERQTFMASAEREPLLGSGDFAPMGFRGETPGQGFRGAKPTEVNKISAIQTLILP
jgi:hypothetical protein